MQTIENIEFEEIRNGNIHVFNSLFEKNYKFLCKFAYSFCRSQELAEEAVQQVFIELWAKRKKIQINTSIGAYLTISVRNRLINEIKKDKTRKKYEKEFFNEIVEKSFSDSGNKKNEVFHRELAKAINNLPQKCQDIFIMSRYEGLSYDEIAEFLGLSGKTIENQMGIAFRKLREHLIPFFEKGQIDLFFLWIRNSFLMNFLNKISFKRIS